MSLAVMELSPWEGRSARLEPGAVIGRHRDCDLIVADAMVSRRHARVCERGLCIAIEDLGSRNGLHVNGRRCREAVALRPGDRIVLGRTTWLVIPANETLARDLPVERLSRPAAGSARRAGTGA